MPKSKKTFQCRFCPRFIAASVLCNHIRTRHKNEFNALALRYEALIEQFELQECPCGTRLTRKSNWFNLILEADHTDTDPLGMMHKICGNACKKWLDPWNFGLTKSDHLSIKRYADSRMGKNNPVHTLLADPERSKKWRENLSVGLTGVMSGISLDEKMGKEAADQTRLKMSQSAKNREVHGHTGKLHSVETKRTISRKTSERIASKQDKVSNVQRRLYEKLQNFLDEVQLEHHFHYYSIDIVHKNFAIEVDGDFWHANDAMGFSVTHESQRRNLVNDANKTKYLERNGWVVIRVWESDINNDIDAVIERIMNVINH